MKVSRQIVVSGAICGSAVTAGFLLLWPPGFDFYRSTTAPFTQFPPGLPRDYTIRPVELPWGIPRQEIDPSGADKIIHFTWSGDDKEYDAPSPPGLADPLDGDFLELIAFATWHPQEDGQVRFRYRRPDTLTPLSAAEVEHLGLERWIYKSSFGIPLYPQFRAVFRTNLRHMKLSIFLSDGRTGFPAGESYHGDDVREGLVFCELPLSLWHDTPLMLRAEFNTGTPLRTELTRQLGAEVVIGNQLRLQWLAEGEGEFHQVRHSTNSYSLAESRGHPLWSLLQVSDETMISRLGSSDSEGHVHWAKPKSENTQRVTAIVRTVPGGAEPLRLVLIPGRAALQFPISGLPDLPNPRSTRNLFDVVIPYLEFGGTPKDSLPNLANYEAFFGFLTVATQTELDFKCDIVDPFELGLVYTFRDVTPQGLLTWYARKAPGTRISYQEGSGVLLFEGQPETWWDRILERWK